MQTPTPKARTTSSGVPQKISPRSISLEPSKKNSPEPAAAAASPEKISPRVVRQLKTRYLDHTASSSNLASRAPKERSPKVADRKSPKSSATERPGKVSELESQISQLENDLKTIKDQLCSTEELKKQAQEDAEESNKQLLALSLKLEESEKQRFEQSSSEEVHTVVLREASEGRDQALQSQLEAIKKQHSQDLSTLTSATNEIEKLKIQLEMVAESEATQIKNSKSAENELHKVKENLVGTFLVVEDMKNQLKNCKESEARAQERVGETLVQLETAKKMVESLKLDGHKAMESYNSIVSELDQSRARVKFLEELVSKLESDFDSGIRVEVERLRSDLEAAEIRYNEEQSRTSEEVKNAVEMVEKIKSTSSNREKELEMNLQKFKYEIEELKANLMDKETELQGIGEENEGLTKRLENSLSGQREQELESELAKSRKELENLKTQLADKETEWLNVSNKNETLKTELNKISNGNASDEIVESADVAEREALMKIGYLMEEVDKSHRKAARAAEQLELAQAANSEMETELRRLKVQSDQWRKAAEAAAAMLSSGNNGQLVERTGSMDSGYSPRTGTMSSPYADEMDDMKKKNANMLRRFGVLWKKPQK